MIWSQYVYRSSGEVHSFWEDLFKGRSANLLYIGGRGFDVRSQKVLKEFLRSTREAVSELSAKMYLIDFDGYELDQDLRNLTDINERMLRTIFSQTKGEIEIIPFPFSVGLQGF